MITSQRPYGKKLRSPSNIKLKIAQLVPQCYINGPNGSASNYERMWALWPWDSFIRPSIDAAIALGANAVKFAVMPANTVGADGSLTPGVAQTHIQLAQLLNYCSANNLAFYANCLGPGGYTSSELTFWIPGLVDVFRFIESIPNNPVVAVDICNECNFDGGLWNGANNAAQMQHDIGLMRTALQAVTTIPITASSYLDSSAEWTYQSNTNLAPVVDFHDTHPYYGFPPKSVPTPADLSSMKAQPWYKGKFLCGEAGVNENTSTGLRTSYMNGMASILADPDCWGVVHFSLADYDPPLTNPEHQIGIYDANLANPRMDILVPFRDNWHGVS